MIRKLACAAGLLLAGAAHAAPARSAIPPLTDAQLNAALELGQEIERRIDGDLNGDGDIDTAYIVASPDERTLHVSLVYRSEVEFGREDAGSVRLAPDRLGPADLVIDKGVLVVRDLTGGTTALSATYRYRFDKAIAKMRLIGVDAKLYSRTFAHDGAEMSWNLLTGDLIASRLKLTGRGEDAAYDTVGTKRMRRPISVVAMDDTPDPETELAAVQPE